MLRDVLTIACKELTGFFNSLAAFLFLGAFLGVTLFVFFWVETFFARNLADVRPLFQWMPVLLIFLVAALTMRCWAEERRAGTLELLVAREAREASSGSRAETSKSPRTIGDSCGRCASPPTKPPSPSSKP